MGHFDAASDAAADDGGRGAGLSGEGEMAAIDGPEDGPEDG